MLGQTLLVIQGLDVRSLDFRALRDVSLTMSEDSTVSLVGADATGHSTLPNGRTWLSSLSHGAITCRRGGTHGSRDLGDECT